MWFGKLYELADNLKKIKQERIWKFIMEDELLKRQIIDLITQGQMYEKGVDGKGVTLGEYAPSTIFGTSKFEGKIQKGERYDHVTLKDTGEMYNSMEVKALNDGLMIIMDTVKEGRDWIDTYPDLLKMTDETKAEIIPEIRERFIHFLRQQTKGYILR